MAETFAAAWLAAILTLLSVVYSDRLVSKWSRSTAEDESPGSTCTESYLIASKSDIKLVVSFSSASALIEFIARLALDMSNIVRAYDCSDVWPCATKVSTIFAPNCSGVLEGLSTINCKKE